MKVNRPTGRPPARPLLVTDVTGRAPPSLRIVSPDDFRTGDWRAPRVAAELAEYVPYCIDLPRRRALYARAGAIAPLLKAKFQYLYLRERATSLLTVPWEHGRLHEGRPPPLRLVFSPGRCGSTLLFDALRRAGVPSLSEPDFFTQAVALHRHAGPLEGAYGELMDVVATLADDLVVAAGGEGPTLVKLRAECCKEPALMLGERPGRPQTLFLVRDFEPWARSTLRVRNVSAEGLVDRFLEAIRCLVWLHDNTNCRVVTYEKLVEQPVETLRVCAAGLGLTLDRSRLPRTLSADAQAGTPLSREAVGSRPVDRDVLDAAKTLWLHHRPGDVLAELGLADLR